MIPILYPADETSFATNGLGRLPECLRCEVTEERNGIYEVEFELPITARHYADITEGMIISAIHDDTKTRQPFIIYRRTAPIDGVVTFYAHHISYLLSGIVVSPFGAQSCAAALEGISSHSMSFNPFTFWTDKITAADFSLKVPTGARQILGGMQGSILDTFGAGEYEFDGFTVKLYQNRGTDSGVVIRYGKNLTELEQDFDISAVAGGVVGWWRGGDQGTEETVYTSIIYADGYHTGAPVLSLDLTGEFQEKPTVAQLEARVQNYITNNRPQDPNVNFKIDFVALWQTPEYKDVAPLERVRLCDTVHVLYPALGVDAAAKVVRTKYNVLTERYDEIELGQPKTDFAQMITAKTEDLMRNLPTESMIQSAIDHATELITGGLGGYVVMNLNADGQPEEILIMDTDDITTAVNVIRMNKNGIGFSQNGYSGTFRSAWTIDGHFVADFIDTGSLSANLIKSGIISSVNGKVYFDLTGNELACSKLVSADNSGTPTVLEVSSGSYTIGGGNGVSIYNNTNNKMELIPGINTSTTQAGALGQLISEYGLALYGARNAGRQYPPPALYLGTSNPNNPTRGGGNEFLLIDGYNTCTIYTNNKTLYFYGNAISIGGNTNVYGDFAVSSGYNKSKIAETSYGKKTLYCYETAEPVFGDIGEGVIDEDGSCYVSIDDILGETIAPGEYQVFLQKEGAGDIWVDAKHPQYFRVCGTPGLRFAWEIKAKQKGFSGIRLEDPDVYGELNATPDTPEGVLEMDALNYLKEQEALYETA